MPRPSGGLYPALPAAHSTVALSGGFIYKPAASRNFASKPGPLLYG
jgi:hypothetical protein